MASVINAVRSLTGDRAWLFKYAFVTAVSFYEGVYLPNSTDDIVFLLIVYIVTGLFFLGCAVSAMHRNINNIIPILPGIFSIPEIITGAFACIPAMLPGGAAAAVIFYLFKYLQLDPLSMNIIKILAVILVVPFIIIPVVLYSARKKFTDAFRYDVINNSAGNFIMSSLLFILQYALTFGIGSVILYFFMVQLFSPNHISITLLYYAIGCASFFTAMIYCSDLYDDAVQRLDSAEDDLYNNRAD